MRSNKTLFIIVTGSGEKYGWSEHTRFEKFQKDDNIDVAICFWGDNDYKDEFWKSAKYIHKQKGMKFHLLRDFFASNSVADEYDQFFIMDDDIFMTRESILAFLDIFEVFDFDLACPGFYGHPGNGRFSRRRASIFRTLNTIDVGAFCMTKRAFLAVLPLINASPYGHGWGFAEWWQQKYHDKGGRSIHGGRMGCIDAAPAEHTRQIGVQVDKLKEEFGSPYSERKFYLKEFMDGKQPNGPWWMAIKQYEYLTGEKLAEALKKIKEKENV